MDVGHRCLFMTHCNAIKGPRRVKCLGRGLHALVSQPAHMMQLCCLDAALLCIAPWGYPRAYCRRCASLCQLTQNTHSGGHHKHPYRATDRYSITDRAGHEFLYALPHSCACAWTDCMTYSPSEAAARAEGRSFPLFL